MTKEKQLFLTGKTTFEKNKKGESRINIWIRELLIPILVIGGLAACTQIAKGNENSQVPPSDKTFATNGYPIPGTSLIVTYENGSGATSNLSANKSLEKDAIKTVVDALSIMTENRKKYPRFDEAIKREALNKVVVEASVFNRFNKEFSFLVAKTEQKGKVILLISATDLGKNGFIKNPEKLIPTLENEFEWVLSKATTTPPVQAPFSKRDLQNAQIKTNTEIIKMSSEEREQLLLTLFQNYLKTTDDLDSLKNQPYYEEGSVQLRPAVQSNSTTKLYDSRIKEALQLIVKTSFFCENTPIAVKNLINGNIWNVAFTKIDERDWATRTRVNPKDETISVGENGTRIKPAKILINYHRVAKIDDPFFSYTQGLPMGALSTDQLANVIALEIQTNLNEKSMRGHVAQNNN